MCPLGLRLSLSLTNSLLKLKNQSAHITQAEECYSDEITYFELSSEVNCEASKFGLPFVDLPQSISRIRNDGVAVNITCVVAEFSFQNVERRFSNFPI